MRQRKKIREKRENFFLGVALYSLFSVAAAVFLVFIFSGNVQFAAGVNRQKIAPVDAADRDLVVDSFNKALDEVESYIRGNISALAEANHAGDSSATVDDVDFINVNRALIFYHGQADRYLAEVVFNDNNHQVNVERFILKIKNDTDYSGGVYGAD
ncbi:MAG: hypothetical protein PHE24_05515 [Patescibacteria group bacterium]|nr:hypothetical protein [Patescibacteria group bacterium]